VLRLRFNAFSSRGTRYITEYKQLQKIHNYKEFRAVLFDLDGTLLDTIADLGDSMNNVLQHFKFPIHNQEKYKYFVGDGIENLIIRALPADQKTDDEIIKQCGKLFDVEYEKNWDCKTKPYPGISELLTSLSKNKIRTAVLSNKPDNFTQKIVKKMLNFHDFDIVMGAGKKFGKKPDPESALFIAEFLKIKPLNFIYLGDTNTDMQTAVNAGMFPVGASWGFRTRNELFSSGAKIVINNPVKLLNIFNEP
jgi:phosphoglycolate phosphatase